MRSALQLLAATAAFAVLITSGNLFANDQKLSGSMFIANTWKNSVVKRESLALKEMIKGNIPDYIFNMKPVTIGDGKNKITFYVTPDYLSIGNNSDHILIPLNFISAAKVAKHYNAVLPTAKMVDAIYKTATVKLEPATMKPGKAMAKNGYIKKHDQAIKANLPKDYQDKLIAGHKKDTVISTKLIGARNRIAIYGWHRSDEAPIQPLSIWHWASYADYSHGIRLVDRNVVVNGEFWDIADVLSSKELAAILSYEGTLDIDSLMSPKMDDTLAGAQ